METEEFLHGYEADLRAMTRADKGIINSLTMLAADYATNCDIRVGIVRTIEKVIALVSISHSLLISIMAIFFKYHEYSGRFYRLDHFPFSE